MGSINIGNIVDIRPNSKGFESLSDHERPKVRATNPNIDHISDGLSRVSLPLARDDLATELLHMGQHSIHIRHHVSSINLHGYITSVSKGNMEHSPVLSKVDPLPAEHGIPGLLHSPVLGQVHQQPHHLLIDPVFAVVNQERSIYWCFKVDRERVEPVNDVDVVLVLVKVSLKVFPCLSIGKLLFSI